MSSLRRVALILWIPFLFEASFIPFLTISIPSSPLSLGRICLVFLGVIGINFYEKKNRSPFDKVILLIVLGSFIGTILSEDIFDNLVSNIGFSLLLLSAISASSFLRFPETQLLLKFFFYIAFAYWVLWVLAMTLVGGELVTYGEIYRANLETETNLINYHAFGLILSVSIVYLSQLNGWLKKVSPIGWVFILVGLFTIFITESRANLVITVLVLLLFYIFNNKLKLKTIIVLTLVFAIVGSITSYFFSSNVSLNRRYDFNNTDYIQQATESRFDFIGLTFEELARLPFGGGVKNNRVNYYGTEFQPHNQYLTFILFAGVLGLLANIIWFIIFAKTGRGIFINNFDSYKPYLASLTVTMMVFFTNDLSGAFFFLMMMFQTWLAKEVLSRRKIKLQ